MKKRGQLTLFIIIGLVILISLSLLFFTTGLFERVDERQIPEEIVPVVNLMDSCLGDLAKEAVQNVGQQGGYIEIPGDVALDPSRSFKPIAGFDFVLPYWSGNIPSLDFIENEMNNYVEDHIETCLVTLGQLNEFTVEQLDKPIVTSEAAEKNVIFKARMPVRITSSNGVTEYADFLSIQNVQLKNSYELAKEMATSKERFMDEAVINLITLDPEIPFTDLEFKCGQLKWTVDEVSSEIKQNLLENVPRMRVKNTLYPSFDEPLRNYLPTDRYDKLSFEDIESLDENTRLPADVFEYKHLFFNVLKKDYSDLGVLFNYNPDWQFNINVRPSNNGVLRSGEGKGPNVLKFLCIQTYHFTYDLNLPIETTVRDASAFNGEGFDFKFGIPVNIDHNQPNTNDYVTVFNSKDKYADVCRAGDKEITVVAKNRLGEDLKDVDVEYQCGTIRCDLGKTKIDPPGYKLRAKVPTACLPGRVVGSKAGYLDSEVTIVSDDINYIDMVDLAELNLDVKIRRSDKLDTPFELKGDQRVVISVTDNNGFDQFITYPDQSNTLSLIYDNVAYDFSLLLMEDDQLIGGLKLTNYTIAREKIGKNIEFNVLEKVPHPRTDSERLALVLDISDEKFKESGIFQPRFK